MATDFERVEPTFGDGPIQPSSGQLHPEQSLREVPKLTAPGRKVPLSRAPGKEKLAVGVPMALVCGAAYGLGQWPLAQMLFIAFLAYALVGLVEVVLGASLVRAGEGWANLRWWQRGLASAAVIVGALALVVTVMPTLLR